MVTSKSSTLQHDMFIAKRLWSAWHWHCILVSGDVFFLLCTLSHSFFALSMINVHVHRDCLAWTLWMVVGSLAWIEGIRVTKPYAQRHALHYRQGVLAVYCAIGIMVFCWSIFLLAFFWGDFTQCIYVAIPFVLMFVFLMSLWRVGYAFALKLFRFRPQAVVIGHSEVEDAFIHDLCYLSRPALVVIGHISAQALTSLSTMSWPYLDERKALQNLIQYGLVDMIIVAGDGSCESGLYQEICIAETCGINAFSLPDLYEHTLGQVFVVPENGTGSNVFLLGQLAPLSYRCWRWVLDICFCLCGGCVLILLLPILAMLISVDSPGPIFYWQERVGYRGNSFRLLKFRSMHVDAEQNGATWAKHMDARITRVGRVLRATHLDELPQVINILRGEMSLIGPRPERQAFISQLEQVTPLFQHRLNIKPGLTGWAQVKAPYASTYQDAIVKLQHDLYYIKHRSFILDICILLKTCVEVFWCSGR